MTLNEALELTKAYQTSSALDPDDEFMLIEAWHYLIDFYGDTFDGSVYMYNLADYYLRKSDYELALKYLERAAACDNDIACIPLGMIWYYGYGGSVDYERAFDYFERTESHPLSKVMLAEMYKEGQHVDKDMRMYRMYIFDAMDQVWDSPVANCKGEVFCKYAEIVLEEDKDGSRMGEIAAMLVDADLFQQEQMSSYAADRDYDIMKRIKALMYRLIPDLELLSIFDFYWALSKPACIRFVGPNFNDPNCDDPEMNIPVEIHFISSHENGSNMEILFDGEWYRDIDHFFKKACFDGFSVADVSFLFDEFEYFDGHQ